MKGAPLYLCVGLGSLLGGLSRWLLSEAALLHLGGALPWGTLAANLLGSFLIGYMVWLPQPRLRLFLTAGFCGGFTTFSIFSLEMLTFLQQGAFAAAGLYLGLSLPAWLFAVWLGAAAGRPPRADQPRG